MRAEKQTVRVIAVPLVCAYCRDIIQQIKVTTERVTGLGMYSVCRRCSVGSHRNLQPDLIEADNPVRPQAVVTNEGTLRVKDLVKARAAVASGGNSADQRCTIVRRPARN